MDDENRLECKFCERINRGDFDAESQDCVSFTPRDPVTVGHVIVVPRTHVRDVTEAPHVAAAMMQYACTLARRYMVEEWEQPNAHILTNIGPYSGQRVWHAHLHVIPRSAGDGLGDLLTHHDHRMIVVT